jgi:septum formation protein
MIGRVILASASYQRQRLLAMLGVEYQVEPSHFDEYAVKPVDFTETGEYVSAIAAGKVLEVATRLGPSLQPEDIIIGGDLLAFAGGRPLGKPRSLDQAREYLQLLMNAWHHEVCAVAIWSAGRGLEREVEDVDVLLPELPPFRVTDYLAESNPLEKAGGFSLAAFAKILKQEGKSAEKEITVRGAVTGVLGFPVLRVARLLSRYGLETPAPAPELENRLTRDILSGKPL